MRTACFGQFRRGFTSSRGVTLVELIIFIVIISIALVTMLSVFGSQVGNSVGPVARVRAMEKAQALLDEILSRKFDEATPTGGVYPCGSPSGDACTGLVADGDFDDVYDYNGYTDGDAIYPLSVSVTEAGTDLGLADEAARLITVTVGVPNGETLRLSAYRANF